MGRQRGKSERRLGDHPGGKPNQISLVSVRMEDFLMAAIPGVRLEVIHAPGARWTTCPDNQSLFVSSPLFIPHPRTPHVIRAWWTLVDN